jgi:phenylacetate-coenzyme A ligase PaaK-like adenylate-forming protein
VECQARQGYHLREADLYVEIVDPLTGQVQPEGEYGEIVLTTLTRCGMPLIRYRTGDVSRFIPGECPCGSVLKLLDKVSHSLDRVVLLGPGIFLTMSQLDEALFPLSGLIDFQADVTREDDLDSLNIVLQLTEGTDPGRLAEWTHERLTAVPGIYKAVRDGNLVIGNVVSRTGYQPVTGARKRLINDHRSLGSE